MPETCFCGSGSTVKEKALTVLGEGAVL